MFEELNFDLPLSSEQKVLRQKITDIRTVVELLCDETNGNVGNIVENARYNQKAHCDRKFIFKSGNVYFENDRLFFHHRVI